MDLITFGKTLAELSKDAKEVISLGAEATPLVGLLVSKGKQTWTYLIGRREEKVEEKEDIAIAVQINRSIAQNVKEYLEREGIDAHLVVVTNSQDGVSIKYLDNDKVDEWREVVADFFEEVQRIQREWGAKTFHLFFATPNALAFTLGCKMSLHYNIRVYNWVAEELSYIRVMTLPRDIRWR
jgi:hypothetical protein